MTDTTVSDRIQASRARLDESLRRINRAFDEIERSYKRLAEDCPRLLAETGRLARTMDSIHGHLVRYDGELAAVQSGVTALGDKSRRLESIMDDYLTGTVLRRSTRVAA